MKLWWEKTSIYQVYPRSFMDSNGDGIGDLKGIIEKLDYLKDLGIETLWISPFYKSPQRDHGYDISDYLSIDPIFGTMEDTEQLIKSVHEKEMKIIFDMVMNHTSIEHSWFKESRKSIDNPKRNWYIWRKGKGSNPPNNWKSMLGKSAWNYDKTTDEWYYSSFLSFQPDLNYDNKEVKETMLNTVRFWLGKGVDGFRLDIFNCIGKDESFKNNPFSFRYMPSPDNNDKAFFQNKIYSYNQVKSFQFAKELRHVVDEYQDRFLIGEVSGKDQILKRFMGDEGDGLHLVFLFQLIHYKFNKKYFLKLINTLEKVYPSPYTPTYVYSNHDVGRGIKRVSNDIKKWKLLVLFQLTSRGIPVIYYGDEIGMGNADIPMKDAQDPLASIYRNVPKHLAERLGIMINRDDARTPMQWSRSKNGGFSDSLKDTWLPLNTNYKEINVESQLDKEDSLLNTYRKLLHIRKESEALLQGKTEIIETKRDVLAYRRFTDKENFVILINFSNKPEVLEAEDGSCQVIFSIGGNLKAEDKIIKMTPFSGCIYTTGEKSQLY
ncbi:MAG: alpha-glucosidase [Bacillota bacterium]|nr:alpha-glucosidase [Bacillota bacterium]